MSGSEPDVRIDTVLYPCRTVSSRWSMMQVSASSWMHGARPIRYLRFVQSTLVLCGDDLFLSVSPYYILCQEGEQFCLVVTDAEEPLPVSRNCT